MTGQPGPGGGYPLAKPAKAICLLDIASLFEQTAEPPTVCPFGHDSCGKGDPCPLHDAIAETMHCNRHFMEKISLAVLEGKIPQMPGKMARAKKRKGERVRNRLRIFSIRIAGVYSLAARSMHLLLPNTAILMLTVF